MKTFSFLAALFLILLSCQTSFGQAGVLDPNDPNVIFTSSNRPAAPAYGPIAKWGHTNRLSWNPYNYGYKSYYYKGMAFRLKFPKTYAHNVADGKVYPAVIFLHGLGEPGNIWDNEYQLLHGGQLHAQKINDGTFDGFMIYPQSQAGYLQNYFPLLKELTDSMAKYVKLDLDRIHIGGLSSGGQAVWDWPQTAAYAKIACAIEPISAAQYEDVQYFTSHITIPVFTANGGQDTGPYAETVTDIIEEYKARGGDIIQSFWPDAGHGVWNQFWGDARYWPWLNAHHKANPLVLFQHNEFCPNEAVNAQLRLQSGFAAYEWSKDGVTIPGATTNQLTVTSYGTYRGRFKRTASGPWSVWSPTPAVISQNQGTVTPPIQLADLRSNVLPAPDGSTTAPLSVPNTYASYEWRRVSDNALVSSTYNYNAPVGQYKVKVTEQFGCGSDFSAPYTVIAANGSNAPDAASSVSAVATSNSSIQLYWNDNPNPVNNETAFEVYRTTTAGSAYKLIAKTGANIVSYLDQGLAANTKYFYIIRAINNTAASAVSAEVNATTLNDVIAPTAPTDLTVLFTTRTSVSLDWEPSTDDIGVVKYEIYVNGARSYVTANTAIVVNNLNPLATYAFAVKALDAAGNTSPASNQVSAITALQGLSYKYYEGNWTSLPNFNELTPNKTGVGSNVSLSPRERNDQFAFMWEGYIKIPANGNYTFETNSNEGSKLYIGPYSPNAVALVNNDGIHGGQYASGTITLTAGVYPITITYFEQTGSESMNIYWRANVSGMTTRQSIPNSAFTDATSIPTNQFPARPGNLNVVATGYNTVNITWSDLSNNETGFEVYRSTDQVGTYSILGTTAAGATSFIDSVGLSAETIYWYKVRAVNQSGQSSFISDIQGEWGLNNNYNDASGNNRNLSGQSSPTFSTDRKEGSHAVSLNGTSQYLNVGFQSSNNFPVNSYTSRTIGVWIKPNAGTISGSNKVVYDFGGSDDGMALRFNSNALIAGIASGNSRSVVTVSNVTSNANWVANGWNHVNVVYNTNTLQLFLNGVSVGTTNLSFTSVGTSSDGSRIGASNSNNAFNTSSTSTNYGGLIDDLEIFNEPLNATGTLALMRGSYGADTTLALPGVPAVPTNLISTSKTTSSISLQFNDNSSNETSFEVYRAAVALNQYRLLATIPGGPGATKTYLDEALFPNTDYYYKVRAIGVGGISAFTADLLVKTDNNLPVLAAVSNFTMRHGSQKDLLLTATDVDQGSTMTFSFADPLPSFAQFNNTGNGTGTLQLNPVLADQGVYSISAIVTDSHNGKDTVTFTVTVNNNYTPVIAALSNQTIAESASANLNLSATDQDGNGTLTWALATPQPFLGLTDNGGGAAVLAITPGYTHAGVYPVTLNVSDGAGATESVTITLTVTNVEPPVEKWFISPKYTSANAPAPWNTISTTNTLNLKNGTGATTSVGIEFLNTNWNAGDAGAVTGNNSGVYPDAVIKDYFWCGAFSAPSTVDFNLKGLTVGAAYNITLFGSSAWRGLGNNGTTIYTINGVAKPLYVDLNNQNTVTFSGITPNASGIITINMSKGDNTPYAVVNAIVLEKPFDDGTAPIVPTDLTAQALADGSVKLSWKDVAYNESSYQVSRATAPAGPFTVLTPAAAANDSTYIDNTVLSSTTYYYKVEAVNSVGSSGFTATVSVVTSNKAPLLTAISNANVKAGNSLNVSIQPTDDAGDVMTTTVTGLPAFATFQPTSNGSGNIVLNPTANDLGNYTGVVVTVTDNYGASVARTFDISVTDNTVRSAYLNFGGDGATPQGAPWNNFLGYPFANNPYGNIRDDANTLTTWTWRLNSQWNGGVAIGLRTGNDKGVFPDNVLKTGYNNFNAGNHVIQFDGLNPAKRYSIGFLTNINTGGNATVTFTNGAQVVTMDGRYNTNTLANLNGLVPSAGGSIQVTMSKAAGNSILILNAAVIREYDPADPIIRPADLFAETLLETDRIRISWSDRSSDETGFEVWRATSANGTYSLVTTTAPNITTYTNTGLTANTRYFYKVRAVKVGQQSSYSNTASAIIAAKVVLIDLNVQPELAQAAPWNSTSSPSNVGATFSNLMNSDLTGSGVEMVITKEFNGVGFAGVNANGVFPANVQVTNYWTDAGQFSQVRFQNLDLSRKYRIGCFGSNTNSDYTTANYICNGKTVELNSFMNDRKVVYLDGLRPGADGELIVSMTTAGGSPYSFTSAFTIEYYDDASPDEPVVNTIYPAGIPAVNRMINDRRIHVLPAATTPQSIVSADLRMQGIKVFPNPFISNVQLNIKAEKDAKVTILMYDQNRRVVYRKEGLRVVKGENNMNLNLEGGRVLAPGMYVLDVMMEGEKASKVVKLLKVN